MASTTVNLVGASGKKYKLGTIQYTDAGSSLGCHARTISSISVSIAGITWEEGDDIRSNKENWKEVYKQLAASLGGTAHVVMSDNFANYGPREHYRKHLKQLGYGDQGAAYAGTIWRTGEVMQIIEYCAKEFGHSMTVSPTSGNASHLSPDGYSACITGVWIKPASNAVVWGTTLKEFWEKVTTVASKALGSKINERPTIDAASLSADPEKAKKEVEEIKAKVANIWGD